MAKKALALAKTEGRRARRRRARTARARWRSAGATARSRRSPRRPRAALALSSSTSTAATRRVSTSDLRADALARFVEDAVAMCKTLAPDPYRSLPDPKLYARGRSTADLEIERPGVRRGRPRSSGASSRSSSRTRRARCPARDKILQRVDQRVRQRDVLGARHVERLRGRDPRTAFWLSARSLREGPRRPARPRTTTTPARASSRSCPSPARIGKNATARALAAHRREEGRRAPTMTMIVENRVAGALLGALLGPLGARVAPAEAVVPRGQAEDGRSRARSLTLTDDPLVPKGFGSRFWDGEGIAAKKLPVFDRGVLQTYYVDNYYGRKLGMAPTTGGSSNLALHARARRTSQALAQRRQERHPRHGLPRRQLELHDGRLLASACRASASATARAPSPSPR